MWELDYKETWVLRKWCCWTVVLEKTLESPLDCNEIQSVHFKGNHTWIFIGRIDVEAEIPILWPPNGKNSLTGKTANAGKDWRQEKEMTEDEMVGWHHPLNGYAGLLSFRMDWLDLIAVQGTLKSLLKHHSSKASILWCSGFFIVQLSHPYMTIRKSIALTRWTFVGKVMPLLFNALYRLVIAFLLRTKHFLNFWLQSPIKWFWSQRK